MEEIQGGQCPCSKMQGGQPTTLPPPCRAPVQIRTFHDKNAEIDTVIYIYYTRPTHTTIIYNDLSKTNSIAHTIIITTLLVIISVVVSLLQSHMSVNRLV